MEITCPFQIKLESPEMTLPEFLYHRFHKFGRQLAMVKYETGEKWLYKDIKIWVDHTITLLKQEGVTPGPACRVGVALLNCPEVVIIQLACGIIGVTCVMLSASYTVDEIWHQVDLGEASHVITEEQFTQKLEDVRKKTMARGNARFKKIIDIKQVVVEPPQLHPHEGGRRQSMAAHTFAGGPPRRVTSPPKQPAAASLSLPAPAAGPMKKSRSRLDLNNSTTNDAQSNSDSMSVCGESTKRASKLPTFLLYFSSGTTGLPKAVEITHATVIVNMQQLSAPYLHPPTAKDRILLQLPLQHMYGILVAYYALYNGCTTVTLEKYRLDCFLTAIQEYKISVLHCVPPQVYQLANDVMVGDYDVSSLGSVTSAGAPLGPEVGEQCRQRLHLQDTRQLFGMTELGGVAIWSRFGSIDVASIGIPLPGTVCKVVHPDKRHVLLPGEMGELCVKGPQIIFKYYKNPKSTLDMFDKEGYVKTGDLAYYTMEGSIYIVDRIKDLIKYKSNQVSPSEMEKLLREHLGVADCAVVGRSDQVAGEVPAAFIVKSENFAMLAAQEIRQFVRGKVSAFKELRGGIFFVSEIPRGVSGKINRKMLKGFWDRKESKANMLSDPNGTQDINTANGEKLVISRSSSKSNFGSTPAVNRGGKAASKPKSRL